MTNMDPSTEKPESTIVVEAYGIKVNARPGDLGEETPFTWLQVLRQVNRHMMRICTAPTRLLAELLEGATRVIRGTSRLPSSVANRIQETHDRADAGERERQESVTSIIPAGPNLGAPLDATVMQASKVIVASLTVSKVEELLQKYRDRGLSAYAYQDSDGRLVIVLGIRPASEESARGGIATAGSPEPDKPRFLRKIMQ